jgi:hypothetical protein
MATPSCQVPLQARVLRRYLSLCPGMHPLGDLPALTMSLLPFNQVQLRALHNRDQYHLRIDRRNIPTWDKPYRDHKKDRSRHSHANKTKVWSSQRRLDTLSYPQIDRTVSMGTELPAPWSRAWTMCSRSGLANEPICPLIDMRRS